MNRIITICLLFILANNSYSQNYKFVLKVIECNSDSIKMNNTIKVQEGVMFSLGTRIQFPGYSKDEYIKAEVQRNFEYRGDSYKKGESITFKAEKDKEFCPAEWIKKGELSSFGEQQMHYDTYTDYMDNDTVLIDVFDFPIDSEHQYSLHFGDYIPAKQYKDTTAFFFTKDDLKGLINREGKIDDSNILEIRYGKSEDVVIHSLRIIIPETDVTDNQKQ